MQYRNGIRPVNQVIASIEPVVLRSTHVRFHPEALKYAASRLDELPDSHDFSWQHHPCHFFDGGAKTPAGSSCSTSSITVSGLRSARKPGPWTTGERSWSGYWALAASLKKAMERGIPLDLASYLAALEEEVLREVFAGDGEIPLFDERLDNLREAGRMLLDRWGGDVGNLIRQASKSAVKLVLLVVESFPSFRDESTYDGRKVRFWKRAQLFAWDLYCAFKGSGFGEFQDPDALTAFADYKLPQVLRELGVLSYDANLANRVDRLEELAPGSPEEIEIRAMTLWAVEAIKEELKTRGRRVMSAWIDQRLWSLGQLNAYRRRPYHRCRTIYY